MKGKTIRIYLVDGVPRGIRTAEIINWTGKMIVSPRAQLAQLAGRAETRRPGVYFLVGQDPATPDRERAYIGESENVFTRIVQHDRSESKDFWTRAILVISKDENLTKGHIRYLESRLIQLTREGGRAIVDNDTSPEQPPLPEPDVADMEFFLEHVQMMLPVLGFTFTQPKPKARLAITQTEVVESGGLPTTQATEGSPVFVIASVGMKAKAQEIEGQMVVLKDSTARKEGTPTWPDSYEKLREDLVRDGQLVDGSDPKLLVFKEDVGFDSPTAAAAVVMGRSANGRTEWKVEGTGETYHQWHTRRLQALDINEPLAPAEGEDE